MIYDEFRGEFINTETGEVVEERVPDPSNDLYLWSNTHPRMTDVNCGLGSLVLGGGKLGKLHVEVMYWRNQSHIFALDFVHKALAYLGLHDEAREVLAERAVYTFRRLAPIIRDVYNASTKALAVIALLITLSDVRFPITRVEKLDIMEMSGVRPETVRNVAKRVFQVTGLAFRSPPPSAYLRRFCSEYGIPSRLCRSAEETLGKRGGGSAPDRSAVTALVRVSPPDAPWVPRLKELLRTLTQSPGTGRRTPRSSTSSRKRSSGP